MISFTKTCLFMAVGVLLCPTSAGHDFYEDPFTMEVVLRSPDSIVWEPSPRQYHGGWCEINFPQSGDLQAEIPGSEGLWHNDFRPNPNGACSEQGYEQMRYKIQRDGNFIARCGDEVVYRTHTHQEESGDYFLAIDSGCELHIYKGTLGCDSIDIEDEIWSSDIYTPLGPHDRLYKGQILHGRWTVVLTPWNGNLEVREELSHGSYEVLWEAEDEWDAEPGPELTDYYAKVTPNGHLILVGFDYTQGLPPTEVVYFDKNLNSGGADCFTLGFEEENPGTWLGPVQPVAVPCEDRRVRKLRGT